MMRILFFGSDYYSTVALKKLLTQKAHQLIGVITTRHQPNLPFAYESVADISHAYHLPIFSLQDKKDWPRLTDELDRSQSNPEIGLVASFGYLVPSSVFNLPSYGTFNIHPSLLPQYRGPSPVQQAILDRVDQTGVSLMKIDEHFDTGQIIHQTPTLIRSTETSLILLHRLFRLGAENFLELLDQYPAAQFPYLPQNPTRVSSTRIFTNQDTRIDWNLTPHQITDQIRAFFPKPIAWTDLGNLIKQLSTRSIPKKWQIQRVKIYQAQQIGRQIQPTLLQIEGKNLITWEKFKHGYL